MHLQALDSVTATITGSGFVAGSQVLVNGTPALIQGTPTTTQIIARFPNTVSLAVAQTISVQVVNPDGSKSNAANFFVFDEPFAPKLQLDTIDGVIGHPVKDTGGNVTQIAVDFSLDNTGATGAFNVGIGFPQLTSEAGSASTSTLNLFTLPSGGKRKIRLVFPYNPADTSPTLGFNAFTDYPTGGLAIAFQPITVGSVLTGSLNDGIPAECNAILNSAGK